jgi:hypothetical protein
MLLSTNGGFQGIDADTITAPSFTWTSDLNTGMWHADADAIGFTTAGVNRITINNSGISGAGAGLTGLNASNISSGTIAAARVPTLNQNTTGSAATLTTARTINGVSFNGSANITVADSTKAPTASPTFTGTVSSPTFNATSTANGGFQGIDADTITAPSFTWTSDQNTGMWHAADDSIGFTTAGVNRLTISTTAVTSTLNVAAPTFSGSGASLTALNGSSITTGTVAAARVATLNQSTTGNAATATAWATGRTLSLTGDVTGTSAAFTGSGNISIAATIAANSVALGTDTTGNYVAGITAGQGMTVSGTAGEGWSPTVALQTLDLTLFPTSNFKKSVRVATTANITLSAVQTIDGIAVVAGNRVLVKNQTTASQNGIYVVAAGAWTRSVAANLSAEIDSAIVGVEVGTVNGGLFYTNVFKSTDVLGTTAMPWYKVTTELDQASTNTANKIVVRDGSGNFSAGTITAALTGNATTATTLATARTIGGVSFNGSANINLPGVNAAGNQSTTGNATTATRLQTARTINGVSFDGTANITVADSTKAPTASPTFTGTVSSPTFNATSTANGGFQGIDADTALLPSFTWTSDQNTGMWNAAADQIGFTSGNGSSLTSLNASNITTGTIADARISGSYTGMTNLTGTGTVDFGKFLGNAADTVTAPSFSWTADTDTGMYQPAANQIAFATAGSAKLTIGATAITSTLQMNATTFNATSLQTVVGSKALMLTLLQRHPLLGHLILIRVCGTLELIKLVSLRLA